MGIGGLIRIITISLFAGMAFAALLAHAHTGSQELAQASSELKEAYKWYSILCRQKQFEDALPFAQEMAGLAEEDYGADDPTTAGMHGYLAENLRKLGRHEEAEALFLRWLPVLEEAVLGSEQTTWGKLVEVRGMLGKYAGILRESGRMEEWESVVARAATVSKKLDTDYPQYSQMGWTPC